MGIIYSFQFNKESIHFCYTGMNDGDADFSSLSTVFKLHEISVGIWPKFHNQCQI